MSRSEEVGYNALEPDKWYPMRGRLSISHPSGGRNNRAVRISLSDPLSGIEFVEMELSHEAFGLALSSLQNIEGRMVVRGTEHIGKKYQHESAKVYYPEELSRFSWKERDNEIAEWLRTNARREGWYIDTYLGSQKSFGQDEGGKFVNISYYRYVEVE